LTRVAIIAGTLSSARRLAESIAEDERIELVDVRAARELDELPFGPVEVILTAGIELGQLPPGGPALVMLSDEPLEKAAFETVRGWLPIHSSADELVAALIAAANDLTVLTAAQTSRWLAGAAGELEPGSSFVETLTPRELEVLGMLADGLGNKRIAGQLGISDHTVKFHVSQILAKLGAHSRAEAVAIGMRRGLVPV
jgi:DNA-binding NarL/FixJ family response regulator